MRETEQLSSETAQLLSRTARESEVLDSDDSLDRVLSHLARSYLIANLDVSEDELEADEELSDVEQEREHLRNWMKRESE